MFSGDEIALVQEIQVAQNPVRKEAALSALGNISMKRIIELLKEEGVDINNGDFDEQQLSSAMGKITGEKFLTASRAIQKFHNGVEIEAHKEAVIALITPSRARQFWADVAASFIAQFIWVSLTVVFVFIIIMKFGLNFSNFF